MGERITDATKMSQSLGRRAVSSINLFTGVGGIAERVMGVRPASLFILLVYESSQPGNSPCAIAC